ncbi:MAG: hypothetical protein IKM74_04330 [Bacteroidales bacterium]|jgi:hypothetical protein|nr:hypothetical protein [Bacteroidales bacterium]
MRRIFLPLLILGTLSLHAQSFLEKSQISGSFQTDAQYYMLDKDIDITDLYGKKFGINGFGKINYTNGNFSAGLRFEAFLPELNGFRNELNGVGLANIFATYDNGFIGITVGDIYDQFGSGLVFRSYEEWSLGMDNSLRGMRVIVRPTAGVTLKGVYGRQRFYWAPYLERDFNYDDYRGIVRGVDGEWNLNQSIPAMNYSEFKMSIGGSFVSKKQYDQSLFYYIPENVGAAAGRINLGYGRFAFTTEYAYKINDPSAINNFIYKEGQSLLSSLSYSQKGLGIVLQVKRTDNMSFKSMYTAKQNDLDINFIPPINYTHTHSLPSMYTYSTQPNGEMAAQFQVNYTIPKGTWLGGKYGTKLTLNMSQVNDIVRDSIMDQGQMTINKRGTLGYASNFFAISDHRFFRDINFEIDKKISRDWHLTAQYINLYYDIETIEGHAGAPPVQANIAFLDVTYKINKKQSIRLELQGLWEKEVKKGYVYDESEKKDYQKRGDWAFGLIEYTINPHWSFSIADKWNYGNPVPEFRDHYFTGTVSYIHEATRIMLSGGRQSEGVVCVGGVCRTVPASSGVSLTVSTSF